MPSWPFGFTQALAGLGPRFGGRRRDAPAQAPAAQAPAAQAAPVVQRASGRDWAALPPIERTAPELELTAGARAFANGLPGAVGVPLALQPLGHARTLDAPSGVVTGLAAPAPSYAGREPLVLAQRRPANPPVFTWPESSEVAEVTTEGSEQSDPVPDQVGPGVELPAPAAPRPVASVAAAPAPAAALTVSRMPDLALPPPVVRSGPPSAPSQPAAAPTLEPASPPDVPEPGPDASPPRRLSVGQSLRLGLGAPLRPGAEPSGSLDTPAVQRSVDVPSLDLPLAAPAPRPGAPAVEARPAAVQPSPAVQRRAGAAPEAAGPLGAPVVPSTPQPPTGPAAEAAGPVEPPREIVVPQPAPLPSPPPVAPGASVGRAIFRVQRRPAGAAPAPPAAPGVPVPEAHVVEPALPAAPPAAAGAPVDMPVVPEPQTAEPPMVDSVAAELPPGEAPAPAVEEPPAVPVPEAPAVPPAPRSESVAVETPGAPLPLLPVQPLAANAPLVAEPGPFEPAPELPAAPRQGLAPVAPPPVVVSRRFHPGPGGLGSPESMPVPASTVAPARPVGPATALPLVGERPLPVTAPREAVAADPGPVVPRPLGAAPAPAGLPVLAAGDLPVQRSAEAVTAGTVPISAWSPAGTQAATAALAPVARAVRPVAQDLPFAVAQELGMPLPVGLPASAPAPLAVSRLADGPAGPHHTPGFIAATVPVDIPVQRAEEGSASATGRGAGGQHSEKELDDLARQLYDRLRSQLRQELLVDRERAGLITDLR